MRAKVALIVFCALALLVLLIMCRREVQVEQSRQPEQSKQSEQSQRLPQSQQTPQPAQSQQPQPPQQSQQSQQRQEPVEPQQQQQSPQPQQPQQPEETLEPHARAVTDVRAFAALLEDYKTRNGAYPTTEQGLEALGLEREDPWGGAYIYQFPSTRNRESYDLFSAGPDSQPDTPDDDWGEIGSPSE